jgi:predicted Zn-dependent protease
MAFNKKQTSTMTKVLIILLVVTFAAGILPGIAGIFDIFKSSSGTSSGSAASTQTTQTAASIGANYTPRIQANDATLKKNPKAYDVLIDQANAYYDWAVSVEQKDATAAASGQVTPLWANARDYYKKALAVRSGSPTVTVDMSITMFYSGDATGAIGTIEGVLAKQPTMPQALLNAGIFYANTGQTAKATDVWTRYQKAPGTDAQGLAYVRQRLAALKKK